MHTKLCFLGLFVSWEFGCHLLEKHTYTTHTSHQPCLSCLSLSLSLSLCLSLSLSQTKFYLTKDTSWWFSRDLKSSRMKRLSSSDSLGGLISICPNSTDEHNQGNNPMYSREYQTMLEGLDEEGCIEESSHVSEKKRRLSVDQVKALEKNFEVENKLEPERKVKLAQELGLQPRQVAVWFQNRRARWKTKQLERDYGILKANYDGLKLNFDKLQHDNESLLKEIRELKSNVNEDGNNEENIKIETPIKSDEDATEIENFKGNKNNIGESMGARASVFGDFKDGSSDSDSSAILNEDNNNSGSPTAAAAISSILHNSPHQFLNGSTANSSSMNINFQFSEMGDVAAAKSYQPQFVKIEEHNFLGEESCTSFFSDDQAPTLNWCCNDEWN